MDRKRLFLHHRLQPKQCPSQGALVGSGSRYVGQSGARRCGLHQFSSAVWPDPRQSALNTTDARWDVSHPQKAARLGAEEEAGDQTTQVLTPGKRTSARVMICHHIKENHSRTRLVVVVVVVLSF